MNSGTTLAASSVYSDASMPMVMPVPTNPQITQQGFKNILRVPVTDDKQGKACISFMVDEMGLKSIAVVHNKEAYGQGIAEAARSYLESLGMEPVAYVGINSNEQDFRPVITQLTRKNLDGLFFGGGYAEAAQMIRQARNLGIEVPIVMGDGCFDSQLIRIAGDAARNCFISNIVPVSSPGSKADVFYTKFLEKHGKIVAFAPLGYVATTILLDAIEKAPSVSRDEILKVMHADSFKPDTIFGPFTFAPNGDSVGRGVFMHIVDGGEFKTYTK